MTFWNNFSHYKNNIALINKNVKISYEQFNNQCLSFAKRLPEEKTLILIEIDNSPECIYALYGSLIYNHSVILFDSENKALGKNLQEKYKPNHIYQKYNGNWELVLLENGIASQDIHPDLSLLISTSGSTGSVKCVRLSKQNIVTNTSSICDYLPITKNDKAALILPIHYCYGLSVLNTHLASGACIHVGDLSVASADFLDYLKDNKISSIAGVPYTFNILERLGFRAHEFPDLKYLTQAGGRLSPDMVKGYAKWAHTNKKSFFVMYGQTEATARIAYVPPEIIEKKPDIIGLPIPNGKLHIKDNQNRFIDTPNTPGELVYEGPNVMMGYAEDHQHLKKNPEHDFLYTGDVGIKDSEGYFSIVGRLKRFSKIYGKRFNLDEMEKRLSNLGYSAVCLSDDETLFIASDKTLSDSISKFIEDSYGISTENISLILVKNYPLLNSGKIDYPSLLKSCIDYKVRNNSQVSKSCDGKSEDEIIALYSKNLKNKEVSAKSSFSDLGGDSLSYVGISIGLEKILGVLPEDWEKKSIKDLSDTPKGPTKPQNFAFLETGIALRMWSILAVVINHAGFLQVRGGAALLLLIGGYNYLRFQFERQKQGGVLSVFYSLILNILIPYWAVILGYNLLKGIPIPWFSVLLIENNLANNSEFVPFGGWFVQALIQSILIYILPLFFKPVREWVFNNVRIYTYSFLLFACILRLADGGLSWGESLGLNGEQISWVLWLFSLGVCIAQADNIKEKIVLTCCSLIFPYLFYFGDYPRVLTVTVGALFIIWVDTIKVPRFILPGIQILAASSLFIYMLHPRAPVDLVSSEIASFWIRVGIGVILGVVAYLIYNKCLTIFVDIMGYLKKKYFLKSA